MTNIGDKLTALCNKKRGARFFSVTPSSDNNTETQRLSAGVIARAAVDLTYEPDGKTCDECVETSLLYGNTVGLSSKTRLVVLNAISRLRESSPQQEAALRAGVLNSMDPGVLGTKDREALWYRVMRGVRAAIKAGIFTRTAEDGLLELASHVSEYDPLVTRDQCLRKWWFDDTADSEFSLPSCAAALGADVEALRDIARQILALSRGEAGALRQELAA